MSMLSCVADLRAKKRLLAKHRRDRKRVRDLLQEVERLSTADDPDCYPIKLDGVGRRVRKALKILERAGDE